MIHSKETKIKLSEMRRGKMNPFYGKKHTDAAKEKMANWTRQANAKRQYQLNSVSISVPDGNKLHYLAGIIDGEGSIRFRRERPFVAVYNTSKKLINWLIENVGGSISGIDNRGREKSFQWSITAAKDVHLLCYSLLPILIIKKQEAKSVIDYLENKYGEKIHG